MKLYDNTPDEINEDTVLRRVFNKSVVRKIDADKRQIEFIISTEAVDRYRDIVEVNGWDLKNYKKNPVVLFGHNSSIPPIGKAVKTWKEEGLLKSIAEFMPRDISPFAHSIFRMYEEGYLRAVSVGFRALKWEWIKDDDDEITGGMRFLKSELLEFSAVPVPANPEALIAARQKGIDTLPFKSWAEELLDNWNKVGDQTNKLYGVDRKEMETIRRRAAGAGTSIVVPPDVQDELMKKNLKAIRDAKAAKAAAKKTKTVELRGIEFELPLMESPEFKDVGTVEFSQDEINGKKVLHIDKADDTAMFTAKLVDDEESEEFAVETRKGEDGEADALVLTIKGDDSVVEYDLIGFNPEAGTLFGMKMSEKDLADAEVVDLTGEDDDNEEKAKKPKPSEDEDEDEEDKATDDDDEDEEGEGKSSDDDDEDDDDDSDDEDKDAKGKKPKSDDDDDDEDDEKSFAMPGQLLALETTLCGFEEALSKNANLSRHDQRRAKFIAGYMRELADQLDGGKTESEAPASKKSATTKQVEEEEDEGMTPEEAENYVRQISKNIQPLLTDLISKKVNKLKGRLD